MSKSKGLLGIDAKELVKESTFKDILGQIHTRYARKHLGLPVFGEEVIVHSDKTKVRSVTNNAQSVLPVLSDKKMASAIDENKATSLANFSLLKLFHLLPKDTQRNAVLGWYKSKLAWKINLHNTMNTMNQPFDWIVYVDAFNGKVIKSFNNFKSFMPIFNYTINTEDTPDTTKSKPQLLMNARHPPEILGSIDGIGAMIYNYGVLPITLSNIAPKYRTNRKQYMGWDTTRGNMYVTTMQSKGSESRAMLFRHGKLLFVDSTVGNGNITDPDSISITAYYGMELTWDYYLNVHGRKGIKDDGKGAYGRTHFGKNYPNAFWTDVCNCMTFGDGKLDNSPLSSGPFVSIDVTAHEMTHGVTSATANLEYSGQSGALNESFSDVFGNAVYFYAAEHGANITPKYWVGEDLLTPGIPGDALRYMDHPAQDAKMYPKENLHSLDNIGPDPRVIDTIDVHFTSGIPNNVFYLLAEGGVNDTSKLHVDAIGRLKAEKIFYRALTVYLSQLSDFGDACGAEVQSAADLYPEDASMQDKVKSAWVAVGLPIEQCEIKHVPVTNSTKE